MTLLLLAVWTARADTATEQLFADKVKPLLDSRCISCHGPDKVKGGLRMDSRAGLLKGGDSGPALVPGNPSDSLLLQAVMHSKKDLEMPPKEKLTTNDIAALRRFVGLTQEQFALAMGISVHTLRNWEQGRRRPEGPAIALLRIAARHPRIIRENVENLESAA